MLYFANLFLKLRDNLSSVQHECKHNSWLWRKKPAALWNMMRRWRPGSHSRRATAEVLRRPQPGAAHPEATLKLLSQVLWRSKETLVNTPRPPRPRAEMKVTTETRDWKWSWKAAEADICLHQEKDTLKMTDDDGLCIFFPHLSITVLQTPLTLVPV